MKIQDILNKIQSEIDEANKEKDMDRLSGQEVESLSPLDCYDVGWYESLKFVERYILEDKSRTT